MLTKLIISNIKNGKLVFKGRKAEDVWSAIAVAELPENHEIRELRLTSRLVPDMSANCFNLRDEMFAIPRDSQKPEVVINCDATAIRELLLENQDFSREEYERTTHENLKSFLEKL